MISSRLRQILRLGLRAPLARGRDRVAVHPRRWPGRVRWCSPRRRGRRGQRAVGVVVGEIPVPQLLEELDRGLRRHLRRAAPRGRSRRPRRRCRRARTSRRAGSAGRRGGARSGQAPLDVGVEGLPASSVPCREKIASAAAAANSRPSVGVARLEDHRAALRAARDVEPAADVELLVGVGEVAGVGVRQELAARPCRRRSRRRARSPTACARRRGTLGARS